MLPSYIIIALRNFDLFQLASAFVLKSVPGNINEINLIFCKRYNSECRNFFPFLKISDDIKNAGTFKETEGYSPRYICHVIEVVSLCIFSTFIAGRAAL